MSRYPQADNSYNNNNSNNNSNNNNNNNNNNNSYNNNNDLQYFGGGSNSGSSYLNNDSISGTMNSNSSYNNNNSNTIGSSYGHSDGSDVNYDDEAPLLEELGIDFKLILQRTLAISIPFKRAPTLSSNDDSDLAGPLLFALLFGVCLLFSGKLHFGYIYGFGLLGTLAMYIVINLISPEDTGSNNNNNNNNNNNQQSAPRGSWPISFDRTMSILGYALLPIVLLAAVNIFMDLRGYVGLVAAVVAITWSTSTATHMFEYALNMREQRWLMAYPVTLMYACFTLLTIF